MHVRLMLVLTLVAPGLTPCALQAQLASSRGYALQSTADAIPLRDAAKSRRLKAGVTLRRDRAPLEEVLTEIARQAQIGISYGEELPRSAVLVSIDVSRLRAADALEAAVRGTPWTLLYAASGQLMVVPRPPLLEGTIAGRILAARGGQPVAGASVLVEGTQLGATADTGGVYRINGVPAGTHTVLARRIGYLPTRQTVNVTDGGTTTLDFTLEPTATDLQAVIVTGTAGNQTRAAQSAVVATVDAAEIVMKAPVSTVSELLTSRVPGITITQGSGTVGAASRINIRGAASISLSNEPIVFIDGVRMQSGQRTFLSLGGQTISALNDLNPNDIESLEVVKGPAAATLYGADASAGVIQIITKKGRTGARRFTQQMSAEYGTIDPNFTPRAIYGTCSAANVAATSTSALCKGQPVGTVVSDNYLVRTGAFDDGHLASLNYSGQGAGDRYGFFLSGGVYDETGTTSDTDLKRRTGRVNFRWQASEDLTTDVSFGMSKNDYRLPKGDQDSYGYLVAQGLANPTTITRNPDGTLAGGTTQTNDAIRNILNEANSLRLTPSVQVNFAPLTWLTNRVTVGADLTNTKATTFFPRNTQNWYPSPANGANLGAVAATQDNLSIYTVDYLGNIRTEFGSAHRFVSDLSFGSQYINTIDNSVSASGNGLITNSANLVGLTVSPVGGQGFSHQKSFGVLMQEQVGFDEKLFLQAAFRVDRNSAFGSDAEAFFLPKFGASYVISEEDFWAPFASAVPTMRVRAAYGTTGRSPGPGAGLRTYQTARFVGPTGAIATGVAPGNPGNPNLKAERGKEFEMGFDADFFESRAGIELTYFNKKTTDLLLLRPIAPSLGFPAQPFANIGEVKNTGFEFMLRGTPVSMRNFSMDATISGSTLDNEVTDLGGLSPLINSNRIVTKGLPLGAWWAYRVRSVDVAAGTVTVSDSMEYAGDQLPTFQGNFSTTVTLFNRLRLYALFDRKSGHEILNFTQQLADRSFGQGNSAERNLPADKGGYTAEERLIHFGNASGNYNKLSGGTVSAGSVSGPYIEDAGFTRFREFSATVDLPARLMTSMRVSGASLTITGRNLGLWTKFHGDPEVLGTGPGSAGTQFTQFFNTELYTLPPTRRWSARVNFQF